MNALHFHTSDGQRDRLIRLFNPRSTRLYSLSLSLSAFPRVIFTFRTKRGLPFPRIGEKDSDERFYRNCFK